MAAVLSWFVPASDYVERSPLFPNPLICLRDMAGTAGYEIVDRLPWNGVETWLSETWEWLYSSWYLDARMLYLCVAIAVVLTLVRMTLNWVLFKRIPTWFKMEKDSADKFPESIWKLIIYCVTWFWAIYLIVREDFFMDLRTHWNKWHPGEGVDPALYWLYVVQVGFYMHCAYASIFIETIRKDFVVLMLHHVLTISLLLYSYGVRYHKIGLLVLFLQDIGDIAVEAAKTAYYFKNLDGKDRPFPEMMANILFAFFTVQHVLFRLYWFPTKVVYSSMHVSVAVFPGGPFYLPFNLMLIALYAMQVYWFKFIVRVLVKILIYKESLRDEREYKEEEAPNGNKKIKKPKSQ